MLALRPVRTLSTLAATALALAALSACGASGSGSGSDDGRIAIVASTNVYGDIASVVAGDRADVTSLITSPSQDPHEYEASAQDRLRVGKADIVIENGGGYDPFVDTLLEDARSEATVIDAVDVSGLEPKDHDSDGADGDHAEGEEHGSEEHGAEEHGAAGDDHGHIEGFNEHVWYDFGAVKAVAARIADTLAELDPDNASSYRSNAEGFEAKVDDLAAQAQKLRTSAQGRGAAITEPVPLYLLTAVGLVNKTPAEFSEAVEEGADVPARVLQQTLDVVRGDSVALLAYNEQAADSTTEQVRAAAEKAGVPVVDFTETLPEGGTYLTWQQKNLDGIAAALR
ncbi:metal ABC transporter solute-binding protein, Zn/Mn family [Nocardioides sp.]|uniref:metal ABC transporter solute-binding protein, Zn/Mn family n=1 Tax=Nocardioides sp. TaxID=35761 RepID=UPI003514F48B